MIKFDSNNFEIIVSDTALTLFGVNNKKVYFFNETSQFLFENILAGHSIEHILKLFCEGNSYDVNLVCNDFKKTIDYLLVEGILYNE